MKTRSLASRMHRSHAPIALLALCAGLTNAAQARSAAEACEAAVTDTVLELRGRAAVKDVQFNAARRVSTLESSGATSLQGDGRYQLQRGGARPFRYSCAYHPGTDTTSGVVFRETGAGANAAATEAAWEPDLSRLSPEACETSAAAAMKDRYPSAQHISFLSDTRKLKPGPHRGTALEGQGRMERAPGLNPVRFSYRCEFEARSGKLLAVTTGD